MLRYLQAAFLLRPRLPGLGDFPLNLVVLAGLGILGFAWPGCWLLGLGVETAYLFTLATNARFQKWVDSRAVVSSAGALDQKQRALVAQLAPALQERLRSIDRQCDKIISIYRTTDTDGLIIDNNQRVLARLRWQYLKNLVSRNHLQNQEAERGEMDLRRRIAGLEEELAHSPDLPADLRQSKTATLELFRKRLEMLLQREQTLAQIDSDLTRIEAQIDLATEQAINQGRPQALATDLDLTGHLLDNSVLGAPGGLLEELEATYAGHRRETPVKS